MTASAYAQPLPRPRRQQTSPKRTPPKCLEEALRGASTRSSTVSDALRGASTRSSTALTRSSTASAAEMRAKGFADEARRRNVTTDRRRKSRERKWQKKHGEPDGVTALRALPPWLPSDDDEDPAEKAARKARDAEEKEAKRKWYAQDLLDINSKVPDNYAEQFATATITVVIYKTGQPEKGIEISQQYLIREPEGSWGAFRKQIEMALGLQKAELIKRERDGTTVMRIASLRPGERYIIEPSMGDALLSTIVWGHAASLQKLRNRPRAPPTTGYSKAGFQTGFHTIAADTTTAQRHLRKALRDATERGWEPDPHDLELIEEAFYEKNEPIVLPKARTRVEVIRRIEAKKDREEAARVVQVAIKFLEAFQTAKKERFDKLFTPGLQGHAYFEALDEVELNEQGFEPMGRAMQRDVYRKCARYICNHSVDPNQAREMHSLEGPARFLRYLDNGPLGDDLQSLQYFLCLNANMAFHGEECGSVPFAQGGLLLACRLLHERCGELWVKTKEADEIHRASAPLANLAPRPEPYTYAATLGSMETSPSVDDMTLRISKSSRARTTEADTLPTEGDLRRVHWWALCVCMNTLRGDRRQEALAFLMTTAKLPEALLQTFMRWHRFHDLTIMLSWVLRELAKESEEIRETLRALGFYTLLKVAQKRHSEVHTTHRDLQLCIDLLRDEVRDPFRLQDKLGEAVGDLELPLLDADASAYREFALHPERVGQQPAAKLKAAARLSRATAAWLGRKEPP